MTQRRWFCGSSTEDGHPQGLIAKDSMWDWWKTVIFGGDVHSLALLTEFCHWIMESSSSESKRSTHVITIQPNETVLTALPYRPQSSLLDFLKGEPKVLGVSPYPLPPSLWVFLGWRTDLFSPYTTAFQEGNWSLFPLHFSSTMYLSWLIMTTFKSFAYSNHWIISRRDHVSPLTPFS